MLKILQNVGGCMNDKIRNFLANTLFVKGIKCLFCNSELDKPSRYCLCDDCLSKLPFITGNICKKCGEPIASISQYCLKCKNHIDRNFDYARAVFLYDGKIGEAVRNLKYYGKRYLAEYLSAFLFDLYNRERFDCDLVIPAPISANSLKIRGYNQAELLCASFKTAGLNVDSNCVVKILETKNQASLGYKDRQTNLQDAFMVVDKSKVKGKKIVIVDDIFTTGATVGEIAKVLKKAKANSVLVLTLCHELPPDSPIKTAN